MKNVSITARLLEKSCSSLKNKSMFNLMKKSRFRFILFTLTWVMVWLGACAQEKEIGKQFVQNAAGFNIQLFTLNSLYKNNHKGEVIPGFDSLSPAQQDSALWFSSSFIQHVDDSLYLVTYVNNFIDEIRALGFKVYLDTSLVGFLKGQSQSYVVNIAQVELDEYYYAYEDKEQFGDSVYYKNVSLNAVDASSWFELSKLNAEKPVKTVLYSAFTATDALDGRFYNNPFSGEVIYSYKIDSLKLTDIYDLAAYSGKKHASFLFDFFMNQYIAYHMPEGIDMRGSFHYNRFRKSIVREDEEQFEILESRGGSK